MISNTIKLGKRGTVVIPASLRKRYGLKEGSQLIIEPMSDGVMLRPVVTLPVEIYSPERKAEFLLNSTTTLKEYAEAIKKIREMGLDPETIPHTKPKKK